MIVGRRLTAAELVRAVKVNDAIALEHGMGSSDGALFIGRELGCDIPSIVEMAAGHARHRLKGKLTRGDAEEAVAMAFVMGALAALRAVKMDRDSA